MKSPFPGMDPYLVRHWGDVHQSAITYIRDSLQPRLPSDLRARAQERVFIDVPDPLRGELSRCSRRVLKAGQVQYWHFGLPGNSPGITISDLSRFSVHGPVPLRRPGLT